MAWFPSLLLFGIKLTIFKHVAVLSGTGGSKLHDWERTSPYYEEANRALVAAKNPKLFDGDISFKKVALIGNEDKFDDTTVAIYFGEENVT
jgi:cholesterol oxidase